MTVLTPTISQDAPAPEERSAAVSAGRTSGPYALLPAFALTAGIVISILSRSGWEHLVLPLEVFADLFIAFFAFRQRSAGARWWRAAAVTLLAGDSFYLAGHLVPKFPEGAFMAQEAFYTLSRFMTAAYLFSNLPSAGELETEEKAILGFLCLVISFISIHYLIIPYFRSGNHDTLFFHVNAVLNRLAESAVFPLALLLGMKARSRYWLYMTHGITLISISSIAVGYYIAINAGTTGIPLQEYGWLCGLLVILIAQAYDSAAGAPFARWNSSRVRLVWLVLVFNLALLLSLYFIQLFISRDAFQLTSILFVFFGLWLVANLIAFRISEDISLLLENVDSGGAAAAGPRPRVAIYEAELFAGKLLAAYDTIKSQSRLAALAAVSAQVAHDIRGPLAALDTALKDVSQLPEEKLLLLRGAAGRIRGIANDLLEKNRQGRARGVPPEPRPLAGLIEPLVAEKRLRYRDRAGVDIKARLEHGSGGLSARVDPVEFCRALSNLIDNAVEALERGGSVSVSLAGREGSAVITVRDDGKGIPPELLARLGRRGATYGKAGGSGLGLYHARVTAETLGGSLSISSEPGKGTAVALELPLAGRSGGAAPGGRTAVLLDNDDLVLLTWRAAARAAGVELRVFKDPAALAAAAATIPPDTPLYIDSDLGAGASGEETAVSLRARGFSDITMATGHPPGRFSALPWLKVTGKEPPWGPAPRR